MKMMGAIVCLLKKKRGGGDRDGQMDMDIKRVFFYFILMILNSFSLTKKKVFLTLFYF
jgi:hypothetical protein